VDSDVTGVARVLAEHALLFLALGTVIIVAAVGAVIGTVRVASRVQRRLNHLWPWFSSQARRIPAVGRLVSAVDRLLPRGHVALHLLLGLIAMAAVASFVIIAREVAGGSAVAAFDHEFAAALHDNSSPRWRQAFSVVTRFGSVMVLAIATVVVAAILLIRRRYVMAAGWIIAQAGGGILVTTLKNHFERERPSLPDVHLLASGWSFPSGHATGTFVFFGMGAYLLFRLSRSWTADAAAIAAATGWCLTMAFSRLYLGVHFASDVIAGLIAAAAWVAVCISGVEAGLRRSSVDRVERFESASEEHAA
jgi:membrane-associated phospholipid phosphatase